MPCPPYHQKTLQFNPLTTRWHWRHTVPLSWFLLREPSLYLCSGILSLCPSPPTCFALTVTTASQVSTKTCLCSVHKGPAEAKRDRKNSARTLLSTCRHHPFKVPAVMARWGQDHWGECIRPSQHQEEGPRCKSSLSLADVRITCGWQH